MSFHPKITIAMPVFNGGDYFELALKSAINQTYRNIEIVIVNDGSEDNGHTHHIGSSYAAKFPDIVKYYFQHNTGVGGALNTVLKNATGEYFCWLSHDDLFLPHKTARQVDFLFRMNNKNICGFSDVNYMDASGHLLPTQRMSWRTFASNPQLALLNSGINGCTLIIPMHLMRKFGPFDASLRYTQDYDLWNRILLEHDFMFQDEVLVHYRLHENQGTKHDAASVEGNPLWIKMLEDRSEIEKTQIFGSSKAYYRNMSKFLGHTPYKEAYQFAVERHKDPDELVLVSVILQIKENLEGLLETARSVLEQSHGKIELLIVGAEQTRELALLMDYLAGGPRVRWFCEDSRPFVDNLNDALFETKGAYIAFIRSGDLFMPNKIAEHLRRMTNEGLTASHTSYLIHCSDISSKRVPFDPSSQIDCTPKFVDRLRKFSLSTFMIHRIILAEGFSFSTSVGLWFDTIFFGEIDLECKVSNLSEVLSEIKISRFSPLLNIQQAELLFNVAMQSGLVASTDIPASSQSAVTDCKNLKLNLEDNGLKFLKQEILPKPKSTIHGCIVEHAPFISYTKRALLLVSHSWGGGIEKRIQDTKRAYTRDEIDVFILRSKVEGSSNIIEFSGPGQKISLTLNTPDDVSSLQKLLEDCQIATVEFHSLVGYPIGVESILCEVFGLAKVAWTVIIHDYMFICPRLHLMRPDGSYCGEPDIHGCERCIALNGSPFGHVTVKDWRRYYDAFLQGAQKVIVPHVDVLERLKLYFPSLQIEVSPPPEDQERVRKILILGTLVAHKGSKIVTEVVKASSERNLPLEYIILGDTDQQGELKKFSNVTLLGAYKDTQLDDIINKLDAHIAWFPSLIPETWSYTLSAALHHSLYPVSFDIGAIAARIKAQGQGTVLPLHLTEKPEELAQMLAEIELPAPRISADKKVAL